MSTMLSLALAALSAAPLSGREPAPAEPTSLIATWIKAQREDRPRIAVWVNRDDPYQRGDGARVYFKSDGDAYVTVIRIDTDGRMRVLFPIDPWEDNFARGGRTFEPRSADSRGLRHDAGGLLARRDLQHIRWKRADRLNQ